MKNTILRFEMMIFIAYVGLSATTSFLALYFQNIGFSNTQIGVLFAVFFLVGGFSIPLFNPIAGNLIKLQKAMPYFLFLGSILFSLVCIIENSYIVAIFIMAMFSIAKTVGYAMLESNIVLFTNEYSMDYSNIRKLGSLAFVLMTLIGGFIMKIFGYSSIFIVGILCYLASFCLSKTFKIITPKFENDTQSNSQGSIANLLKNKKFWLFLFGQLFICSMPAAADTFTLLYYNSREIDVAIIGIMTSSFLFCEFLTMCFLTKYIKKLHGAFGQITLGIIMLTRCICFAFDAPIYIIYALVILQGLQSGILITVTMNYIRNIVEIKDTSSAYMLNTLVSATTCGVINIFSGVIIDNFSFRFLFIIIGSIITCSIVLILIGYAKLYKNAQ